MSHDMFGCEHEKEFGQIAEASKRYDEHIKITWKKIDQMADAINSLRLMAEKQGNQLAEICTLRQEMLSITNSVNTVACENKRSTERTHQRIDAVEKLVTGHQNEHCDSCASNKRLEGMDNRIEALEDQPDALLEIRTIVTQPYMTNLIRFLSTWYGQVFVLVVVLDLLLDFYAHYEVISKLWTWAHLGGH